MQEATDVSPQLLETPKTPVRRALLAVGRHESSEFIRQNREYGEQLERCGTDTTIRVIDHRDHFDLPYDLLREGTTVGDWVLEVLKGHRE
jgi:arylformamidase